MSRILTLLFLGLVALCGAVHAQQASFTLFPEIAEWDDVVEVRIQGTGCPGEYETAVHFLPWAGWIVDIDLKSCSSASTQPFSTVVEIGPLFPQSYTVQLQNWDRNIVSPPPPPFDTATLSVRREASLDVELPEEATDAAPVSIVLRGSVNTSCFVLEPPVVTGNVIEATFEGECPILPIPGPHVFEEELQVGPLPPGEYDVRFFEGHGQGAALERETLIVHATGACVPSDTALCLQEGRFRIEVDWKDFKGSTGKGHAIPLQGRNDSGLFWYFQQENIELTAKVLNGCGLGGHWWVFLSSGSTVEFTVTVTDTQTGNRKTYKNGLGESAPLIADTSAFSCN